MNVSIASITPCLWFDTQAEEAARFYVSVFSHSRIIRITHYGKAGQEVHGRKEGSVMSVEFQLGSRSFTALNGGPQFPFTEAVSFQIPCETQEEIDYYWARLTEGGSEGPCGWLKDRYGLSWQVFPEQMAEWIGDPESERSQKAMTAMMKMTKINLETIKRAYGAG